MNGQDASVERDLAQAVALHQAGRLQEAERLYRAILQVAPGQPQASHNLGRIAFACGRGAEALQHLKAAVEADPTAPHAWLVYIDALIRLAQPAAAGQVLEEGRRRGLPGEAISRMERRIAALAAHSGGRAPSSTAAGSALSDVSPGTVSSAASGPSEAEQRMLTGLFERGHTDGARQLALQIIRRYPQHPFGWKMLGRSHADSNRITEAIQPLANAARLAPTDSETLVELALALEACGRWPEAERHLRAAERLRPDDADIQNNLGVLLGRAGRHAAAEPHFRKAIELRPDFPEGHNNLGILLQGTGRMREAEGCFREALRLQSDVAGFLSNLGGLCQATGRMNEAEGCFRRATEIEPENVDLHSNLLFCQGYSAHRAPLQCLADARRFGQIATGRVKSPFARWPRTAASARLRVGFVSGDLHQHPVGYFLEGLLSHLDRTRLELFAYPTAAQGDALTAALRARFDAWKPLVGLSDEAAAGLIHADGIHVLLDLSGHTAHNRLPVFAWKAAPVQATWLGYFATTGMSEMDFLLADEVSVPVAHQGHFSETVWYLPHSRLCFTPPQLELPVAPLPALARGGQVTFGNFQNLAKLGEEVVARWAQILAGCPGARLRLQNKQLADAGVREQFRQRLQAAGIDVLRVEMHGPQQRQAYLAAYGEVDIVLDSFPYPGGTTTCEALWMGVPTVTLAGDRLIARQGASLLGAAGLADWVAATPAEYVDKALAFARALPALAGLRARLRAQLLASPLCDAPRFARHFEEALWAMWQQRQATVS